MFRPGVDVWCSGFVLVFGLSFGVRADVRCCILYIIYYYYIIISYILYYTIILLYIIYYIILLLYLILYYYTPPLLFLSHLSSFCSLPFPLLFFRSIFSSVPLSSNPPQSILCYSSLSSPILSSFPILFFLPIFLSSTILYVSAFGYPYLYSLPSSSQYLIQQ